MKFCNKSEQCNIDKCYPHSLSISILHYLSYECCSEWPKKPPGNIRSAFPMEARVNIYTIYIHMNLELFFWITIWTWNCGTSGWSKINTDMAGGFKWWRRDKDISVKLKILALTSLLPHIFFWVFLLAWPCSRRLAYLTLLI